MSPRQAAISHRRRAAHRAHPPPMTRFRQAWADAEQRTGADRGIGALVVERARHPPHLRHRSRRSRPPASERPGARRRRRVHHRGDRRAGPPPDATREGRLRPRRQHPGRAARRPVGGLPRRYGGGPHRSDHRRAGRPAAALHVGADRRRPARVRGGHGVASARRFRGRALGRRPGRVHDADLPGRAARRVQRCGARRLGLPDPDRPSPGHHPARPGVPGRLSPHARALGRHHRRARARMGDRRGGPLRRRIARGHAFGRRGDGSAHRARRAGDGPAPARRAGLGRGPLLRQLGGGRERPSALRRGHRA